MDMLERLNPPQGVADVVLDTDAYNEVDDQFALSYLLRAPERANVLAVTAAPFLNHRVKTPGEGMEKSALEVERLLALLHSRTPLLRGATAFLKDEKTPADTEAARRIVELALKRDPQRPLYVVAIGAITNVASALLLAPEIASRIVVVFLGGHALHYAHNREFNLRQDVAAARAVFLSGVPLVLVPCRGVADVFTFSEADLRRWFMGCNPLCDDLAANAIAEAERTAPGAPWARVLWDVTAAAWITDREGRFLASRLMPRPLPEYSHLWSAQADAPLCRYVYHVGRDALARDLVSRLTGRTL